MKAERTTNVDVIPPIVGICLSLLVIGYSESITIGSLAYPGPGLWPFLAGALLLLASIWQLVASRRDDATEDEDWAMHSAFLVAWVISLFVFFTLLLQYVGFAFAVAIVFLAWPSQHVSWVQRILATVGGVIALELVFRTGLGIQFPEALVW